MLKDEWGEGRKITVVCSHLLFKLIHRPLKIFEHFFPCKFSQSYEILIFHFTNVFQAVQSQLNKIPIYSAWPSLRILNCILTVLGVWMTWVGARAKAFGLFCSLTNSDKFYWIPAWLCIKVPQRKVILFCHIDLSCYNGDFGLKFSYLLRDCTNSLKLLVLKPLCF